MLQPASRAYGEKRSVRSGPASRSSGNAERLGRQAETAFRGGARWRSSVGAFAAGRPGGLPRHMRRAPSPGPAAAPPEQRRDGRRSAGTIGSSSELSAHFDDARKINSWNPVRDAVRRSLPCARNRRLVDFGALSTPYLHFECRGAPVVRRGDARVAPPCPTTSCVWRSLPYLTLPLTHPPHTPPSTTTPHPVTRARDVQTGLLGGKVR